MEALSLYIHIPFCMKKCYYCDFLSYANKEESFECYSKVLIEEIQKKADHLEALYPDRYEVRTIFFGGGTPTVLPPIMLERILETIFQNFRVNKEAEITLEANPGTLEGKGKLLHEMGFNRISLGVQAWQNRLLEGLGRIHTIETFLKNYEELQNAGFSNINADLMFSLPEQTLKDWEQTLLHITELAIPHISCYSLILEEGTVFWNLYKSGKLTMVPEDTDRQMYELAKEILAENGYEQYEISNFAKPHYRSRHNCVYWQLGEYLGFGLGAHSYFQKERFHNTTSFEQYLEKDFCKQESMILSEKNRMEEFMFLGLRMMEGVSRRRFYSLFHQSMEQVYGPVLKRLIKEGLLIQKEDAVALTSRGIDVSNAVFAEFLL